MPTSARHTIEGPWTSLTMNLQTGTKRKNGDNRTSGVDEAIELSSVRRRLLKRELLRILKRRQTAFGNTKATVTTG
jgi:hypothetical protein